jgi:integrase
MTSTFVGGKMTVRTSKTPARRRVIPVLPELCPQICAWQRHQFCRELLEPDLPFLATANGTAMHAQFAWHLVKRVAQRESVRLGTNGESEITPHSLRRTLGSDLLNRGVGLEVVSRRSATRSTQITEQAYAELLDSTVAAEVLNAVA